MTLRQQTLCNISQYIAMCNISIFPSSHIVLYCSNKYCNISIYCNIVSSLVCFSHAQCTVQYVQYDVAISYIIENYIIRYCSYYM